MKHVTPGLSVLSAIWDILSTLDIWISDTRISHYLLAALCPAQSPAALINPGNIQHNSALVSSVISVTTGSLLIRSDDSNWPQQMRNVNVGSWTDGWRLNRLIRHWFSIWLNSCKGSLQVFTEFSSNWDGWFLAKSLSFVGGMNWPFKLLF